MQNITDAKWRINNIETERIHFFGNYTKVISIFLQSNQQAGGIYRNRYISKYMVKYNDKNAIIYESSGGNSSKKPQNYQKIIKRFIFDKVKRISNGLEFSIQNKSIKITNKTL